MAFFYLENKIFHAFNLSIAFTETNKFFVFKNRKINYPFRI